MFYVTTVKNNNGNLMQQIVHLKIEKSHHEVISIFESLLLSNIVLNHKLANNCPLINTNNINNYISQ